MTFEDLCRKNFGGIHNETPKEQVVFFQEMLGGTTMIPLEEFLQESSSTNPWMSPMQETMDYCFAKTLDESLEGSLEELPQKSSYEFK